MSSRRRGRRCRLDESHQRLKPRLFLTRVVLLTRALGVRVCVCVCVSTFVTCGRWRPTDCRGLMVLSKQLRRDGGGDGGG